MSKDTSVLERRAVRIRRARHTAGRLIATRPFTTALTVVILVGAIVTRSLIRAHPVTRSLLGTGYKPVVEQGHWWSPITALFFTNGGIELLVVLVLVVLGVGFAEGRMGTWKTVVAYVSTGVAGTIIGITVQAIAASRGEMWSDNVRDLVAFSASSGLAGALMAASAFASVLWRRRIRVLTLLVCVVAMLYSGLPSDLYRILAALLGLALGYGYRPSVKMVTWVRSSHHEVRVLLAATVAITAIGPAISLLSRTRYGPLAPIGLLLGSDVVPKVGDVMQRCQVFDVTRQCVRQIALERINGVGPVLVSIIPLLVLLIVAWGLLRGRRFAVWLGAILNGFLALLAAIYFGLLPVGGQIPRHLSGHYWEVIIALAASVLLPAAVMVLLIVFRRAFSVRSSSASVARYLALVAVSGIVLAAIYVGIGWAMRDTGFTRSVTLADLLADVTERFIPVSFLRREVFDFFPATPLGSVLYHGVGPVFWAVVALGAIVPMLDPVSRRSTGSAGRARRLLKQGGDAISFMTTWPGNEYWFDPVTDSAIAYRVIGGIAVTTGGPFGSGPAPGVMQRFARFCDDRGWVPTFYSIDASHTELFANMGWDWMTVAEETVIDLGGWAMTGKRWQDVRSSVNRAKRAGIRGEWTVAEELPLSVSTQIAEISELWIAEKGLPEMGFTLGGIDELQDPEVRLMLAIDESGTVHGITSWLPCYRDGLIAGWTLDFMRRRPGSMNGVMEFLIAEAATRMHADGTAFMSLSGAPLAHTAELGKGDRSSMDRVLGILSTSLEPLYGFRSLLLFKKKFQPRLRPVIMAYPDPIALPRIGFALARAYLPDLSVRQVARLMRVGS